MKIIFLGDSLTEGKYGGSYIEHLGKQYPHHELINAGVNGNTIINLLQRLDEDILSAQPDGVFVMVGGNDAISYSQPATRVYYRQVQDVPKGIITPEIFSQSYRTLLETLRLEFIPTWIGLPPNEYSKTTAEAQRLFNGITTDIARSMSIPTLDLLAEFNPSEVPERRPIDIGFINTIGQRTNSGWNDYDAEQQRGGYGYSFDGLHLTPKSAQQMAEKIATFLEL